MRCIYCHEQVPQNWFEHHCIPVVKIDGKWVDMYNRLAEINLPVENVAHWLCFTQNAHPGDPTRGAGSPATRI